MRNLNETLRHFSLLFSWRILVPALLVLAILLKWWLDSDTYGEEVGGKIPLHIVRYALGTKILIESVSRDPKDHSLHLHGRFLDPIPKGTDEAIQIAVSNGSRFSYPVNRFGIPISNDALTDVQFHDSSPSASSTLHWCFYFGPSDKIYAPWSECDSIISFDTPNPGHIDPVASANTTMLSTPGLTATLETFTTDPDEPPPPLSWDDWFEDLNHFKLP